MAKSVLTEFLDINFKQILEAVKSPAEAVGNLELLKFEILNSFHKFMEKGQDFI